MINRKRIAADKGNFTLTQFRAPTSTISYLLVIFILSMVSNISHTESDVPKALIPNAFSERNTPMEEWANSFFEIFQADNRFYSFRCDAGGNSSYGMQLISQGGTLEGFQSIHLDGRNITLQSAGKPIIWDIPFLRTGYYDADLHVNYPSEKTTAGAFPLRLPIRKMVASSGQILYMEHFKRLPAATSRVHDSSGLTTQGAYHIPMNLADGNSLLLGGDVTQNFDLKIHCPGVEQVRFIIGEDYLRLLFENLSSSMIIEVIPRGLEQVPDDRIRYPQASFSPDFLAYFEPTGKPAAASQLLTNLLRMGIYWHPGLIAGGEWGLGAVETHHLDDPRSWYLRKLREDLLYGSTFIGYDRFEHFGYKFPWGKLPDYGAGGLLNVPPGNAPYDMRIIHMSSMWIVTMGTYVLTSMDMDFLHARQSFSVSTNGNEPQPLCGGEAKQRAFLLPAGDVRLDENMPQQIHTLGQTFTASQSFSQVMIQLGNESNNEPANGIIRFSSAPGQNAMAESHFTLQQGVKRETVALDLGQKMPPGKYYVEIADKDSGVRYFGPGIFWWMEMESKEKNGEAYFGPFSGNNYDRMQLLFDFTFHHTGASREHLSYYQNDRKYNVLDQKSGRIGSMQNSFWECLGGGYDAFAGLWYNAACSIMAEMAELMNRPEEVERYRELRTLADETYNQKYWYTVKENGRKFSRYYGVKDWDGKIWDFGFTYYNLEAAARGIATPLQGRQILWWLDRGQYSPDGGTTWKDDIYSIWDIATPFNTIENHIWLGPTGTLPYMHVLTNGGTRLDVAARDLQVRARYLSTDSMHERLKRVLGRFASPDRLTGGRTVDDPGGRGRWHFGPPDSDRADIEGFREIFPQNGILPAIIPGCYLGFRHSAKGLEMAPGIPSELQEISFENLGYAGGTFNFVIQAIREEVNPELFGKYTPDNMMFRASVFFNKAGVQVEITPFQTRKNNQLALTLDEKQGEDWQEIAWNWYNHAQDGQWVWVRTDHWLSPDKEYRLRIHDIHTPPGEMLSIRSSSDHPLMLRAERIHLTVGSKYPSDGMCFEFIHPGGTMELVDSASCLLEPGQKALLRRR